MNPCYMGKYSDFLNEILERIYLIFLENTKVEGECHGNFCNGKHKIKQLSSGKFILLLQMHLQD